MVYRTTCQKTADSDSVFRNASIAQNDHREFIIDSLFRLLANSVDRFENPCLASRTFKRDIDRFRLPPTGVHVLNRCQLLVSKNWMRDQQTMAVCRRRSKQILFWADITFERHDDVFSNRIDRRIGDLGKELLKIVVHEPRLIAQTSQRGVVPHRTDRIHLGVDHREQHKLHRFDRITKGLHARQQRFRIKTMPFRGAIQIGQGQSLLLEPIFVGL